MKRKKLTRRDFLKLLKAGAIDLAVLALGGAQKLVAVSNYCQLPPGLQLPRVGSSLTPSFEAIAGLRPSLILCDGSAGAKYQIARIPDVRSNE